MSQQINTLFQWRYEVSSADECQVTDSAGNLLLTVQPGSPAMFVADGLPVVLSSDSATMLPANTIAMATGGGTAAPVLSATGEPVVSLTSAELTVRHATWFDNAEQADISIIPAIWQNEVMTCYLRTSVPVTLTGVQWLYGEPTMAEGYTYVIALQQIDAATVLANLAYVLPQ